MSVLSRRTVSAANAKISREEAAAAAVQLWDCFLSKYIVAARPIKVEV